MDSTEERKLALNNSIRNYIHKGYRLEYRDDFSATLSKPPKKINNWLHLILTILTAGFWLIIWLLIHLFSNKKTNTISISV